MFRLNWTKRKKKSCVKFYLMNESAEKNPRVRSKIFSAEKFKNINLKKNRSAKMKMQQLFGLILVLMAAVIVPFAF